MNRLLFSIRVWWNVFRNPDVAQQVQTALNPPESADQGPDLRILALLQRDGRLIDFLQEDISNYSDDQVGSAVREIHRSCQESLAEHLKLEPVLAESEGDAVTISEGFDPSTIRLSGNLMGEPPFQGVLKHHGWRASKVRLPEFSTDDKGSLISPAEVELT